jgi:hypothetical protein
MELTCSVTNVTCAEIQAQILWNEFLKQRGVKKNWEILNLSISQFARRAEGRYVWV